MQVNQEFTSWLGVERQIEDEWFRLQNSLLKKIREYPQRMGVDGKESEIITVSPYERNRVRISSSNLPMDEDPTFVNASFVHKEYIAAAMPQNQIAERDFWRMVLEHNSRLIIMLNQANEKQKEPYWPKRVGDEYQYGDLISVRLLEQTVEDSIDCIVRKLRVTFLKKKEVPLSPLSSSSSPNTSFSSLETPEPSSEPINCARVIPFSDSPSVPSRLRVQEITDRLTHLSSTPFIPPLSTSLPSSSSNIDALSLDSPGRKLPGNMTARGAQIRTLKKREDLSREVLDQDDRLLRHFDSPRSVIVLPRSVSSSPLPSPSSSSSVSSVSSSSSSVDSSSSSSQASQAHLSPLSAASKTSHGGPIPTLSESGSTLSTSKVIMHAEDFDDSKIVYHIQHTDWPDMHVPDNVTAFLDFIHFTDKLYQHVSFNFGSPMLVHCFGGAGRTGTFLTIHIAIRNLLRFGGRPLKIAELIDTLRNERCRLVETLPQFKFCYRIILENYLRRQSMNQVLKEIVQNHH